MPSPARTLVARRWCSIFFIIAVIARAAAVLNDEAISFHNCIEDASDSEECQETEMHPNVPQLRREMKTQKEKTNAYWLQQGIEYVKQKAQAHHSPPRRRRRRRRAPQHARNIIFFIGDGMSLATLAAARLYLGGEEQSLSFEKFPHTGLARTYALDRLVPDSAATATALLCGVKTKHGIIGLDGRAKRGDCGDSAATKQSQLTSIGDWAMAKQKWAGFVTTARVTDATTASLYAHSSERMWENDADLKKVCGPLTQVPDDIGLQLMTGATGARLKVVMGGGRAQLRHKQAPRPGLRSDGRDLINEFVSDNEDNVLVQSSLDENWINAYANLTEDGRFMGLFSDDHLPYHLEANALIPSLAEMTAKAVEILNRNENGFFLLVESGKIDLAHHANKARLAVDETAELHKAVAKALELTNANETLIVVTADHGHTMSLAGYACRSSDIFGVSNDNAADDLSYKVLSYANGPGYKGYRDAKPKWNLVERNKKSTKAPRDANSKATENSFEIFPATVPLPAATHGGEDVPVFASGPWSHLFSGVYEQSTIPHLMAFASCLDKDALACRQRRPWGA